MRFLVIDDDGTIVDLVSTMLENYFDIELLDRCFTPRSAIEKLELNHYDMIICDYEMYPHGTGEEVFDYSVKNKINSAFILFTSLDAVEINILSTPQFQTQQYQYLQKPVAPKKFISFIQQVLEFKAQVKQEDYYPVRIHNFLRFRQVKCDIYIKLSHEKYVKIIGKKTSYDVDLIDKYIEKSVDFFYIHTLDYMNFLSELGALNYLATPLESGNFLDTARRSHRYIATLLKGTGISDHVISEADYLAQSSLELASKERKLSPLLIKLLNSNDYPYDHTFLITVICVHLCREIGLTKSSEEKLCFASIIHDIGLASPQLCYIHDLEAEKISHLSKQDQQVIKEHHFILKDINNLPDITGDVSSILEHHHLFDQKYPYKSTMSIDRLNMLVSIFIGAHCFSNLLYSSNFDLEKSKLEFANLEQTLPTKNFDKVIKALKAIL